MALFWNKNIFLVNKYFEAFYFPFSVKAFFHHQQPFLVVISKNMGMWIQHDVIILDYSGNTDFSGNSELILPCMCVCRKCYKHRLVKQALKILLAEVWVSSLFCRRVRTKENISRMLKLNLDDLDISRFLLWRFFWNLAICIWLI